jgi:hypothetical protein
MTLDELNRRERIAYEQMRRHSDNPNRRQFNLWQRKWRDAQEQIEQSHHSRCSFHTDQTLHCTCERERAWDKRHSLSRNHTTRTSS